MFSMMDEQNIMRRRVDCKTFLASSPSGNKSLKRGEHPQMADVVQRLTYHNAIRAGPASPLRRCWSYISMLLKVDFYHA